METPLSTKRRETLDGIHDLAIALEVYKLEQELEEAREAYNERLTRELEEGTWDPIGFEDPVHGCLRVYDLKQRIDKLISKIKQQSEA